MHACLYFVKRKFNFWPCFPSNVCAKVTEQINYIFVIFSSFVSPYFQSESLFSFSFPLCISSFAQRLDISYSYNFSWCSGGFAIFFRRHAQLIKNKFISTRCLFDMILIFFSVVKFGVQKFRFLFGWFRLL